MKRVSLLTAVLILFGFMSATAAITFGGHLGVKIEDVKDPGASIFIGLQQKADKLPLLGENDYIRFIFKSVNFGDEQLDNVSAMEIHYLNVSEKWDLGTRIAADYQTDDGQLGVVLGLEFIRKEFVENLSTFICFDVVKKPEMNAYFNFGIGLIIHNGE